MRWELYLLGRFQLAVDGQLVDEFEADSARALCAYLCLHAGAAIRRDHLATLLWPEQSQESALRNLRTALSRLRRGLGPLSEALYSTNQTVALILPHAGAWVDALALLELNATINAHTHRRLEGCPRCLASAQQIADLYAGDFLAGFTLESETFWEWASLQRETFHCAALDAIAALSSSHLQRQEWRAAERYARHALRLEPWREESHRHLMLALASCGQRTAALRQFRLCEQVLRREFDAAPEAATVALYEQIRQSKAQDVRASGVDGPGQLAPGGPHWLDDLPFVGRVNELDTLSDWLVAPTARLITLVGESGVGKTRLAVRAARRVAASFPDGVFHIELNPEQSGQVAYASASIAVERVAQHIAYSCAISLDAKVSHEVNIKRYFHNRSSLLLLDGFEQSEASVPFLLALLEEAPGCVLMVTTHRPLSVRQEWVLRLKGLPTSTEVESSSTDAVDVAESLLLFELLVKQRGVAPSLHVDHVNAAWQICQAVDGLPLGIELAVACLPHIDRLSAAQWSAEELALILQRAAQLDEHTLSDLPPRHRGLRALFETTWQLLDEHLQQTLASIAVFHTAFTPEAAATVTNAPTPAAMAQHLWRLMDRSLLQSLDGHHFRLHDRIHRFAMEKLAVSGQEITSRQRHAHYFLGVLADAETTLDGPHSFEVQQHLTMMMEELLAAWQFAIRHNDWELIGGAVYAFAQLHLLRGLYATGERLLHEAIRALRGAPDSPPHVLARLQVAWSRLIGRLEPRQDAEAALVEALTLCNDDGLRADILIELGWRLYSAGRTTEAADSLQEALAITARLRDTRRSADALNRMAAVHQRRSDGARALSCLEEALALARQAGDLTLAGIILNNLSIYFGEIGETDRTLALLREALAIHRMQRNARMEVSSLYQLGIWHDARCRYGEAQQYYQQALELAEGIPDLSCLLAIWTNIGISRDQMGDYTGALAASLRALEMEPLINNPQLRCTILANLGLHCHHLGEQAKALEYAQMAVAVAEAIEMPIMAACGYDFQGHAYLALERPADAEIAYYQALALRQQIGATIQAYESRAGLARVKLAQHNLADAATWVAQIAEYLMQQPLEGVEEPLRVYWTVYTVLEATDDSRTDAILMRALDVLHRTADQFFDPVSRQRYLTQVEAHQHLLQAAAHRCQGNPVLSHWRLDATGAGVKQRLPQHEQYD